MKPARWKSLMIALGLGAATLLGAPDPSPPTFVYKTVGALEIKADVYVPAGAAKARPVVVYLHGGSLINGKRQSVANWFPREEFLAAGAVVVSVDYRLAPETKLRDLVQDVEDAFAWVRRDGPALFGADPHRVAVTGGSAGGYLALLMGARLQPCAQVVYAEMSYGDLLSPWQLQPSVHRPHYTDSNLEAGEAWKQVSGPTIANAADRNGDGGAFNDFIRRNAGWPRAISGWDPQTEAARFEPYRTFRQVTAAFPPTAMVHGEMDSDVPVTEPQRMAELFKQHGVEHRLLVIPNGDHGFRGADPATVRIAQRAAVDFVLTHLNSPTP
jgi:acetyl esterase/lipase